MKKILVTGKSSYIANSFKKYIEDNFSDEFIVDIISVNNVDLSNISFKGYDILFHCAGIAHSDYGYIRKDKEDMYYKNNTYLTGDIIKKSYNEGIKQFIYMSSIIIYGNPAPIGRKKIIDKTTLPKPINAYGNSKMRAEYLITDFAKKNKIIVSIIRSPMVYGEGCKGNFNTLKKLAKILPIFPYVDNERSVININRLCEFVKKIIDENLGGLFLPQDDEYMNTSLMVKEFAKEQGKNILLLKGFTPLFKFLSYFIPFVNKAFGNMVYEK